MKAQITTRDDLSFTQRDSEGRLINWPRNSPGVAADWQRGLGFFDDEVCGLASLDETEAYNAIRFAIAGMGVHSTNLEIAFIDRAARAAILGMRSMREGSESFEPVDKLD
jgi:hypothetical protein